ncbi:MAG: KamA family radical SAM protein [Methanomassiliicoccus sp.]|nr:KamA family radical SAM protein [Methanomassiliicoccus sp.]
MNEEHLAIDNQNQERDEDMRRDRRGVSVFESIHADHLRKLNPELFELLASDDDIEDVRINIFNLTSRLEFSYHSLYWQIDALERVNALYCIQVLRNLISPRNEKLSGCSTLTDMVRIARSGEIGDEDRALFVDFYHIVKGAMGMSGLTSREGPDLSNTFGREAARKRSDFLDVMSERCNEWISKYPTGLDPEVVARRKVNRERIMDALGASEEDWNDHHWQLRHVRRKAEDLDGLIELTDDEHEAIEQATGNRVPFGITPYYLSLMDFEAHRKNDHAIRAQVIPPLSYVKGILDTRTRGSLDFMREGDTSPVDLVTRRYPMIAILKPYNSCAQICVYCQRNWEIDDVMSPGALAPEQKIREALQWFEDHPMVTEILITGGDPLLISDNNLRRLLTNVAGIEHIKRVRFGTRLPVVLPMRFTDEIIKMLGEFNDPAKRELCLVTHFEHPYEVTPETMECIRRVRRDGLSVYNQQVFTMENSRRFETVALRLLLKQIGVDPYYTFNTKGKEETEWYRVPIARILQERKEESRMIPGLARTDVPVFNIPALGKNNLTNWQNHDLIMISPRGERVYEFHPWEKNIVAAPTYVYRDVPILRYLERLRERSEDPMNYASIWYYF